MVKSSTTSISPAEHAARHSAGAADALIEPILTLPDSISPGASGITVFSGGSPTTFTDLDLSAIIGSRECLVCLQVTEGGTRYYHFCAKGDTELAASVHGYAANRGGGADHDRIFFVNTDNAGIIRWETDVGAAAIVKLLWYIPI